MERWKWLKHFYLKLIYRVIATVLLQDIRVFGEISTYCTKNKVYICNKLILGGYILHRVR